MKFEQANTLLFELPSLALIDKEEEKKQKTDFSNEKKSREKNRIWQLDSRQYKQIIRKLV